MSMRVITGISLIFITSVILAFHAPTLTTDITGKISGIDTTLNGGMDGLMVFATVNGILRDTSLIGKDHRYSLMLSLGSDARCIDLFVTSRNMDTVYITSWYPSFTEFYEHDIALPARAFPPGEKAACPKCRKRSKVYSIGYCFTEEVRAPRKKIIVPPQIVGDMYFLSNCPNSKNRPSRYCSRDRIKF